MDQVILTLGDTQLTLGMAAIGGVGLIAVLLGGLLLAAFRRDRLRIVEMAEVSTVNLRQSFREHLEEKDRQIRELKAEGLTVIFISHKLGEVLSVADEITVIRRGTTVGTVDPRHTTSKQLAELMVGSELPTPETEESTVTDVPMLKVSGLHLSQTDLDGVAEAYCAMDERRAIKSLVRVGSL